jgi:predicted small lipoprotein YifL
MSHLVRASALVLVVLMLATCGKKSPPQPPPGIPNTYPQHYPKE